MVLELWCYRASDMDVVLWYQYLCQVVACSGAVYYCLGLCFISKVNNRSFF